MKRAYTRLLPPILAEEVKDLPTDRSTSWWAGRDPNAGRCLVAIYQPWANPRYQQTGTIYVRNIYSRQDGTWFVECMNGLKSVSWPVLYGLRWRIYQGPFNVASPAPQTQLNFAPKDQAVFDAMWDARTSLAVNVPSSVDLQATPLARLFTAHWHGLEQSWDAERISALCRVWNLTLEELAAFLNIRPQQLLKFMEHRVSLSGSTYILLELLENLRFGLPTLPGITTQAAA